MVHNARTLILAFIALTIISACGGGGGGGDGTNSAPAPTLSADASMSSLTLSDGVLSPNFLVNQLQYDVLVDPSTITFNVMPTTSHSNATVIVNGNTVISGTASPMINLAVGDNTISIAVTAENGNTIRTYVLTVSRLSDDATLAEIDVSSGTLSPAFSPNVLSYTVAADPAAADITVSPIASAADAVVTVNGIEVSFGSASDPIALSNGDTNIQIVVTAEDGVTTQTYTLSAHRVGQDASLSDLSVSTGALSPSFDANTFAYTHTTNAASLSVSASLTDTYASLQVRINGAIRPLDSDQDLVVARNTVVVTVTAEDGVTTRTYSVVVTRRSSDATLSDLTLSSGTLGPAFSPDVLTYSNTTNATVLTVTPTTNYEHATVIVNGSAVDSGSASPSIALLIGPNTITTVVNADDGTTSKTYTVTVNRLNNDVGLSGLSSSVGTVEQLDAFTYTQKTAETSLSLAPILSDSNATVTVNGLVVASGTASNPIALNLGTNVIELVVTAADGVTSQVYTNSVTRVDAGSQLLALTITPEGLDQPFDSNTTDYTATVRSLVDRVRVTPIGHSDTLRIRVNGVTVVSGEASSDIPIDDDSPFNTLTVDVLSRTGGTETYSIDVYRRIIFDVAQRATIGSGGPVALSGNTLAIGSNESVSIFVRDSTDTWILQASVSASISDFGDRFGESVALDGDTLAVGAPGESSAAAGNGGSEFDNSAPSAGAAYIFTRDATGGWTQQSFVKAYNADASDRFGSHVALLGNTLAVAAPYEDGGATGINGENSINRNTAPDSGAVYIYLRNTPIPWSSQAYVKASNTWPSESFGSSISLDGNKLAVGAAREVGCGNTVNPTISKTICTKTNAGAAYIFAGAGQNWVQEAYVKSTQSMAGDQLGTSVAIHEDTLVVGGPGVDGDGAAFVVRRSTAGVWGQIHKLTTRDGGSARFGRSVEMSDDRIYVGGTNWILDDSGEVFIFRGEDGDFSSAADWRIKAVNWSASDEFGYSLSLDDGTLAIGGRNVYVFE